MTARGPAKRRSKKARSPRPSSSTSSTQLLQEIRDEHRGLAKEMTFAEYLDMVKKDPTPTRVSHHLIRDMIHAAGVRETHDGRPRYELFRDQVFGADDIIRQVAEYFDAAARRLEVRRRILLLLGPPGCGKSTIVNAIKAGLEAYTRSNEGAVYAIKGCPVNEEPLHLIPPTHRAELKELQIEGDLCPHCRWLVREVHKGNVAEVPVERVTFSVTEGVGIGTFVATDPRSEDLTRLVGSVDTTLLEGKSRAAARKAFRLDGELCAANRGLADLIEIFKMDERFLAVLLTLSQEQFLKISGPMAMYADEAIVAHSNLAEYDSLIEDPKSAALQDRLVAVRVRYVLSVRDEIRIYEKLLGEADAADVRVSPLALPAAATLAVLTRLTPPKRSGWDLRKKLHVYDGRFVAEAETDEVAQLRRESPDEGLSGVSPRFVLNQLSQAIGRAEGCLTGSDLLDALWEGLEQRASFREEQREGWETLFETARDEYDDMVRRTVRRAMVEGFGERAEALAEDVLGDLRRWRDKDAEDADVPSLRRVERALGVPHFRRGKFRTSLLAALEDADEREEDLSLADPRIEEAIERELLPSWVEAARALAEPAPGRTEAAAERKAVRERLMKEEGFSAACADDVLSHAKSLATDRLERKRTWFGG